MNARNCLRSINRLARSTALATILTGLGLIAISPPATSASSAPSRVLFVLDASGSMWAKVENRIKMDVAKSVLSDLINELPTTSAVGLQIYGHRRKGDCNDIEMLLPAPSNRPLLLQAISRVSPRGKTPIAGAMTQAADQVLSIEDSTSIVLISDGAESCGGDPCQQVERLRAGGIAVRVHVVGFDVAGKERAQLQCIAKAGGGKYYTASNAQELKTALTSVKKEVMAPVPSIAPLQTVNAVQATEVVMINFPPNVSLSLIRSDDPSRATRISNRASASTERPYRLDPGSYKLSINRQVTDDAIEIPADRQTPINLLDFAAVINFRNSDGSVVLVQPSNPSWNKRISSANIQPLAVLPGTYRLKNRGGEFGEAITVSAGDQIEVDLGR